MNNISVFNPENKPKVQKWLNNVARLRRSLKKNSKKNVEYERLYDEYIEVRNMINKNSPVNTMGRVNSAFSNLNNSYAKTAKGGKKRTKTFKKRRN